MERRVLVFCRASGLRVLATALFLLLCTALTLGPARRAAAQAGNTHIVISEVVGELDGTDRARYYFEFANLGSTAFDFKGCWIYMWAEPSQTTPLAEKMIQIAGTGGASAADASKLQPIPPGGVLLVAYSRPNATDGYLGDPAGPNVFDTGYDTSFMGTNDIRSRMAIALFAPQTTAPPAAGTDPNFGGATMLAYYFQGNMDDADGSGGTDDFGAGIGMRRANQLGLWQLGTGAPYSYDAATVLRWPAPAPGQPFPAAIGRRYSDYYVSHYGMPDMSNTSRNTSDIAHRPGSPGQPNLQFAGTDLIPGQTFPSGYSLAFFTTSATMATTAAGSPAATLQIAATTDQGLVAANSWDGKIWAGWQYLGGPVVGKPLLIDNPKTVSRSLFAVDAYTGQLYVNRFAAVGTNPAAFQGFQAIGGISSDGVAAAVDATSGTEAVVYDDATGVTQVVTGTSGTFAKAQPLPGNAKLVDVSIASTPSGFAILGFDSTGQLMLTVLDSTGKLSALSNVGTAIANRPRIPASARFNPLATQLEVLIGAATTGAAQTATLQLFHVKLGATNTVSAAINVGLSTEVQPGLAVNTDTGDVTVFARVADYPIPSGERLAAFGSQAQAATLANAGTAFKAPVRLAAGIVAVGTPPEVTYNANTKKYEQFVVGEDLLLYHNTAAP